ncbi:hypothetical protein B0H17DRAFT_1128413 [Mycena rosella]|uniref:Uncharacterized protein n=1 Tax=Mycena rosella TaxID=1033263 RepID=A0AAD7DYR8_MYCRO|nr:hypothetical protein B0H17DRAFT_1128413 [Mycena rosella]
MTGSTVVVAAAPAPCGNIRRRKVGRRFSRQSEAYIAAHRDLIIYKGYQRRGYIAIGPPSRPSFRTLTASAVSLYYFDVSVFRQTDPGHTSTLLRQLIARQIYPHLTTELLQDPTRRPAPVALEAKYLFYALNGRALKGSPLDADMAPKVSQAYYIHFQPTRCIMHHDGLTTDRNGRPPGGKYSAVFPGRAAAQPVKKCPPKKVFILHVTRRVEPELAAKIITGIRAGQAGTGGR